MSEHYYKYGALAVSYEGARFAHTTYLNRKFSAAMSRTTGRVIIRTRFPSTAKIGANIGRGAFQAGSAAAKLGQKSAPSAGRFLGRGARFTGVVVKSPAARAIGRGLTKFILPVSVALGIRGAARGILDARTADSGADAFLGVIKGAARGFVLWE